LAFSVALVVPTFVAGSVSPTHAVRLSASAPMMQITTTFIRPQTTVDRTCRDCQVSLPENLAISEV
jgi:hypothetical protein